MYQNIYRYSFLYFFWNLRDYGFGVFCFVGVLFVFWGFFNFYFGDLIFNEGICKYTQEKCIGISVLKACFSSFSYNQHSFLKSCFSCPMLHSLLQFVIQLCRLQTRICSTALRNFLSHVYSSLSVKHRRGERQGEKE